MKARPFILSMSIRWLILILSINLVKSGRSRSRERKLAADHGAFGQHALAEPEELGRTSDSISGHCACFFNEFLLLDETEEVLLVHRAPSQRLDRALQLRQCKFFQHKLEHDRTIFDLGAQPGNAGGENAAVITRHGAAGDGGLALVL